MKQYYEELLNSIPLKSTLYIMNQMAMIDVITECGYRENKAWSKDENEIIQKLSDCARKLTNQQLDYLEKDFKIKADDTPKK